MNRTIKFRGKRIDNGEWVYGYYVAAGIHYILTGKMLTWHTQGIYCTVEHNDFERFEVIPETVGQFVGLYDATGWEDLTEDERDRWTIDGNFPSEWKGKEIYEGDIFTVNGKYPKLVRFIDERAAFCIANIDDLKHEDWEDIWQQPSPVWWSDFDRDIEVIGNIHDNKDLLTTKE